MTFAKLSAMATKLAYVADAARQNTTLTTTRLRVDYVVAREQEAQARKEAAPVHTGQVQGEGVRGGKARLSDVGHGAIPKVHQDALRDELEAPRYTQLRASILARFGEGGEDVLLDCLQMASSGQRSVTNAAGVSVLSDAAISPLMTFFAESKVSGVSAELVDSSLGFISTAAKARWPELLARYIGLTMAVNGALAEVHEGHECRRLAAQLDKGSHWAEIDLAREYDEMQAMLNGGRVLLEGKSYDTREKVEAAWQIADILSLKGF